MDGWKQIYCFQSVSFRCTDFYYTWLAFTLFWFSYPFSYPFLEGDTKDKKDLYIQS